MNAAYTRHCTRAKAQGFTPVPYYWFVTLAEVLA